MLSVEFLESSVSAGIAGCEVEDGEGRASAAPAAKRVLKDVGDDDELRRLRLRLELSGVSVLPPAGSSTRMSCPDTLALLANRPCGLVPEISMLMLEP